MLKKIITLALLYCLAFVFLRTTIVHYGTKWYHHYAFWYFAGSFIVAVLVFKRYLWAGSFYSTLRHELCHWFFALISFNKPHALNVNGDGSGQYAYSGKGNYFIALAPYFFPLVTVSLLLMQIFALAFDLTSMKNDYHLQQSDWHQYGIIFSIQFSLLMLVLFLVSVLIILWGQFTAYPDFIMQNYEYIKTWF